mmetsp:Transcript_17509/g.30151  ORF Transcript_17509/g.30151 Transcript_17509/m.30151 type:complete len:183 (+) Transcript_17509:106-654(+)|eukprot:CAMPEP_0183721128 /NCGR_PEP_ID=MMETSP0737-20130205/13521_1 /TAXON_ID=385413 /ORGANISM="Thalassiosira miniscula, Strain CCMP1093" /LENGTH=182 /DNA_ID=CAMNT_0025951099 /DNA_START=95 /DNA_END=643 /DNA_ORIENTATION=+
MNLRSFALVLATARSTAFAFAPQSAPLSVASSRLGAATFQSSNSLSIRHMSAETTAEPRKAGVSSPSELKDFVSSAGSKLLVVDVRHPDATVEPGDAKSLAVAGFPDKEKDYRPQAVNLPWSRESKSMEFPVADKDTPIITHCGGGGRGQKAKDYLEKNGFTNVLNGGGPKETDCWAEFGDK